MKLRRFEVQGHLLVVTGKLSFGQGLEKYVLIVIVEGQVPGSRAPGTALFTKYNTKNSFKVELTPTSHLNW